MPFCPFGLENGVLCLAWTRSLVFSGTKDCEGWPASREGSRPVSESGTSRHYVIKELSGARPLLLTRDIRIMITVPDTSQTCEAGEHRGRENCK